MDVCHPFDSGCDVSFKLMVCSGHHVSLRLLSLHVCNEYPSLPKKEKKGLLLSSQLGGFGWRDIGDTLALYFSIFSRLMHEAN